MRVFHIFVLFIAIFLGVSCTGAFSGSVLPLGSVTTPTPTPTPTPSPTPSPTTDTGPTAGLVMTFDYDPAVKGLSLLQGGPTKPGYAADFVSHPDRIWQPRHRTDGQADPKGNANYYHFDFDPEYAWSNAYSPFAIAGTELRLRARSTASVSPAFTGGEIPTDPNTSSAYDWLGGLLTTEQSFQQRGGYFEIDAKLPTGYANWPAFWLTTSIGTPEVDVIEIFGGSPGYTTAKFSTNAIALGYVHDSSTHTMSSDLGSDYHKYGVYWNDTTMKWYFDRTLVRTKDISALPEFSNAMYMLVSNQVGSRIAGFVPPPNGTTPNPSDVLVRSVRAWQRPGPVGLDLSAFAYVDDLAVGGVVANLSTTTFGGNNSLTYSIVSDPDNMFTISANTLRLGRVVTAASDDSHPVTLKVTDSAGRTFTRQATITALTAAPASPNLVVSQNLQSGWANTLTTFPSATTYAETAVTGQHQIYVTPAIVKPASIKTYRFFADIDVSAGRPFVVVQLFNGGYSGMAYAAFDVVGGKTGYTTGTNGFSVSSPFISPLTSGKSRIGFTVVTDAAASLQLIFNSQLDASTPNYAGDPSKVMTLSNIWLYEP